MTPAHAEAERNIRSVMVPKVVKLKNDKFRKSRGGHSRWLLLSCEKCKEPLMVYQKDGLGILKRLYFDRITIPKFSKNQKNLICKKCKTLIGVPMVYEKENRIAYRLFSGAIEKKIVKKDKISRME